MPMPDPLPESERAAVGPAVVGSPGTITGDPSPGRPPRETVPKTCPICGAGLRGRQTSACSDKHRAAKSRQKRVLVKAEDARLLRDALISLLDAAWEMKVTLDAYL